jgi:hypothetical protein
MDVQMVALVIVMQNVQMIALVIMAIVIVEIVEQTIVMIIVVHRIVACVGSGEKYDATTTNSTSTIATYFGATSSWRKKFR